MIHRKYIINTHDEVLSFTDKKLLQLLNRSDFGCCKIRLYGKIFINDTIIEDTFYFFIDNEKTNQDFKKI